MITLTKVCVRCKIEKPLSDYYVRSGCKTPTEPGHYNSECKDCLKERSKHTGSIPKTMPRAMTEIYALRALALQGIPALPGKAVSIADVDVVAWLNVFIEVKYSKLADHKGVWQFVFNSTPKQMERGYLAHVVMLICDYRHNKQTFHLFNATDPVFYIERQSYDVSKHEPISEYRIKSGFTFVPGRTHALKHGDNRVVMTQDMMDAAQDNWNLIEQWRVKLSEELRQSPY